MSSTLRPLSSMASPGSWRAHRAAEVGVNPPVGSGQDVDRFVGDATAQGTATSCASLSRAPRPSLRSAVQALMPVPPSEAADGPEVLRLADYMAPERRAALLSLCEGLIPEKASAASCYDVIERVAAAIIDADARVSIGALATKLRSTLAEAPAASAVSRSEVVNGVAARMRQLFEQRLQQDIDLLAQLRCAGPSKREFMSARGDKASLIRELRWRQLSLEELRRLIVKQRPHFSALYAEQFCWPRLRTHPSLGGWRFKTDSYGKERNFLLAAHLANRMYHARPGATYQSIAEEMQAEIGPLGRWAWKQFAPGDIELLAAAYPFVPTWPGGVLTPDALGAHGDRQLSFDDRVFFDELQRRLASLAAIPLASEMLAIYDDVRGAAGCLEGSTFVATEHALADKFPMLWYLIEREGLRGEDVFLVIKHGSADETVIDTLRRCFGVNIVVADSDDDLEAKTKIALSEGLARAKELAPAAGEDVQPSMAVHLQGVRLWQHVDGIAAQHPGVRIAGVSHTTFDAREVEGQSTLSHVFVSNMASSTAKRRHERKMFRRSFIRHIQNVLHTFDIDAYANQFVVLGYGKIIGSSVALALAALDVDYVVYDPYLDPQARAEAEADGVRFVDRLPSTFGRNLFLISCAGARTFGAEHFKQLEKNAVIMSLSTGRGDFDMKFLEQQKRSWVGQIGHQPTYAYTFDNDQGNEIQVVAVGDGEVANFADARPNLTYESALNNIIVVDSLREALAAHQKGERGARVFNGIQVGEEPGRGRPVVYFGNPTRDTTPIDEILEHPLAASSPDAPVLFVAKPEEGWQGPRWLPYAAQFSKDGRVWIGQTSGERAVSRVRLVKLILAAIDRDGIDSRAGTVLECPPSPKELASTLGTSETRVASMLQKLANEGLLVLQPETGHWLVPHRTDLYASIPEHLRGSAWWVQMRSMAGAR